VTDYTQRSTDLDLLHPAMRVAATRLLAATQARGVKFIIWEAYRHPERQDYLYKTKVKMRNGKMRRRTRAKSWTSYHQYGIACDFVLDMPGCGHWANKTEEQKAWWKIMHEEGAKLGLRPLSSEKPHMQMVGLSIKQLRASNWPPGGDYAYVYTIRTAMQRHKSWRKPKRPPSYPEDMCRPPTSDGLEY